MTGAELLREEGRLGGEARGEAKGRALAVLRILDRPGIGLSGAQREQVWSCRDLQQLERWLDRALSVESAADLFA